MAASDAFYRDQKTLNRVFAATSVAMLVTVVWMFADDFNRSYKHDQRKFRDVEEELNKRVVLSMAPSIDDQGKILDSEKNVTAARARVNELKPLVDAELKNVIPKRAALDFQMRSVKAEYDSKISYFNIAVEQQDQHAEKYRKAADDELAKLNALQPELEKLDAEIEQANLKEFTLSDGQTKSLAEAQKELKALEASHKALTGDFDRFLKLTAQKRWKFTDTFRSLPVIDSFASPIKINQTFHDDLPIDYGGFKYVTRYDRCTTCHLGIDKPSYDKATISRLAMDPAEDKELQTKVEAAKKLLEERQKANKDAKQDVNLLQVHDLEPRLVKMSEGQKKSFAAHPRLDLFVDANSAHAADKFGCTICHSGQGSATSFIDATHTPNDAPTLEHWRKDHHWRSIHDWDFPMLPSRFMESSCLKCHHQVEDLVRDGSRVEAEKLVKGFHLVKDLGCFGCHEISGAKSGRAVGPDLRLEPDPPLESLAPAERVKRLADTANPPGTYRKVGPSLSRIAEKTNEDWAMKWLKAPRVFRPDTKMPHFYEQANNVQEALPDDQKKFPDAEARAITHYLFQQSQAHLSAAAAASKRPKEYAAADAKQLDEMNAKLARAEGLSAKERKELIRQRREIKVKMAAHGQPAPVEQTVTLPNPPGDDAGKKGQIDNGRQLFATKGCVACHRHEGMETAGQFADGRPLPALVGESYFGPELGRVAAKLGKPGDPQSGKKWLVQWLQNPNVHSPRTLMPNVHLTLNEADDIASWLLAQTPKPDAEWDQLKVAPSERETLMAMARNYLRKAGLTTREVESAVKEGFTEESLNYRPDDADEQMLAAPIDDGKLLNYIGKKAIGNLGCFACHNIPGFESFKPIGVALNDWGKKDVDRIAYEDAENYVTKHYNVVELRDDTNDKSKPSKDWQFGNGTKPLERFAPYDTAQQPPYEKFFSEMLDHSHRKREGFLHLKLMSPRVFDYQRVRDWNDRARMPQFKFNRARKLADESDEAYKLRSDREEAEAREAVMTFVLGMIAEPIPPKYLPSPAPDRAAEIKGRAVLEKYNCSSCHLIRPGHYEMNLTDEVVKGPDGQTMMVEVTDKDGKTRQMPLTYKQSVIDRLMQAHKIHADNETGDPKEHAFPEHNAWGPRPQSSPDKLMAYGVQSFGNTDLEGGMGPSLRLTQALSFKDSAGETKTLPASPPFGIAMTTPAIREVASPYGGRFALLLKRYLTEFDAKVYGDVQPLMRYDDESGQGPNGYAALPPPLLTEGERVQPAWLYQFLLNPQKMRKIPPLQMPKFNMSDEEAMALVNYFGAANRLGNPGIGLASPYDKVPQRDEAYLLNKTKAYVERLKANKLYDERVNEMKPLWARVAKEQLTAAESKLDAAKVAKDDAKTAEVQKEVDALKSQVDSGDFPALKAKWEEREAYIADTWKMMTYDKAECLNCHQIGAAQPKEYRAPNLDIAWERLRPEWSERWIGYPQRLTPYASLMQPLYKPGNAKVHKEETKVFDGNADEQIQATRDLLMMFPMIADWPVIKYRIGVFGPPAPLTPPK